MILQDEEGLRVQDTIAIIQYLNGKQDIGLVINGEQEQNK